MNDSNKISLVKCGSPQHPASTLVSCSGSRMLSATLLRLQVALQGNCLKWALGYAPWWSAAQVLSSWYSKKVLTQAGVCCAFPGLSAGTWGGRAVSSLLILLLAWWWRTAGLQLCLWELISGCDSSLVDVNHPLESLGYNWEPALSLQRMRLSCSWLPQVLLPCLHWACPQPASSPLYSSAQPCEGPAACLRLG